MKAKHIIIGIAAFLVSMGIVIAVGLLLFVHKNADTQTQERLRPDQEETTVTFNKNIESDAESAEAYALPENDILQFVDANNNVVLTSMQIASMEVVEIRYSDQDESDFGIRVQLTSEGSKMFSEFTQNNIGSQVYIVVDGAIVSAPTIQEAITGGELFIGYFSSMSEAEDIMNLIKSNSSNLNIR